jgi:acetylornithine deacetylase/succinyl-diaminopimelate desuccinylase-like protein
LLGHRDTVFARGEVARRRFSLSGDRAYGPGVADMKAGLVMNAFILAAFRQFADHVPVVMMMTGDEEIGSQASLAHIGAEARFAKAVFNAEPARVTGNFVTGRKGGFTYRFTVEGKAAHAGVNFTEGASAIGELAHKINALHALTDVAEGITLNVGLVSGGSSTNTVAARAAAELDVRFIDNTQRERLIRQIEAILRNPTVAGTSISFDRQSESLPLAPTPEKHPKTNISPDAISRPHRRWVSKSPANIRAVARIRELRQVPARRPFAEPDRSAARRIRKANIFSPPPFRSVPAWLQQLSTDYRMGRERPRNCPDGCRPPLRSDALAKILILGKL